ncbi:MAG TPA: hypothetical protein VGQ38_15545 [Gaiellaceae bacterium]|nr:hypothetical protein [Gaiellaceae bacterium]
MPAVRAEVQSAADFSNTCTGETARRPLTARQQQILDFIMASIAARGFPPTIRDIMKRFGWASTNAVTCHLRAIAKKGAITMVGTIARGLVLAPHLAAEVAALRPAPPPAVRTRCPKCGEPARGVYRCIGCQASGCGACCVCTCD